MASITEFLGLLLKDPVDDKDTTFNIETMLNENWRKLDAKLKLALFQTGGLLTGPISSEEETIWDEADLGKRTQTVTFHPSQGWVCDEITRILQNPDDDEASHVWEEQTVTEWLKLQGAGLELFTSTNGDEPVRSAVITDKNAEAHNMARIVTGSYTGTGTGPKTLTFPFVPKLVVVEPETTATSGARPVVAINGTTSLKSSYNDGNNAEYNTLISWAENSVTFSSSMLDTTNIIYRYIAIG